MSALRFDDRVVIVTGAGNGLGRAHARLFARRGAKVVVNDLGGSLTGQGRSSAAAEAVAEAIRADGGQAVANADSVEEGERVVQCALDHFGRVDVVVNNAGILRDVSFHKMTADDWDAVYRVHVLGAFRVTHAAWPHLRRQGYGRVVMTSSAAGLYGNFGQANYAMAKLGLLGFARSLAVEGRTKGVHVNAIAPVAGSRMTETILPPEVVAQLEPEHVSPLVAWLCHEDCDETGAIFEVGGGFFAKLRWARSAGAVWRIGREITPEQVRDGWSDVTNPDTVTYPAEVAQALAPVLENIQRGPSRGGNEYIDVDKALAYEFPETTSTYDETDLTLYALAVGAGSDPTDMRGLRFVYELHGDGLVPMPTFGVIPAINAFIEQAQSGALAEIFNFGVERILHGEHRLELRRPLPTRARLTHKMRVLDVFDKGKHGRIDLRVESFDDAGALLMVNTITAIVRGIGGWGGDRGPEIEPIATDRPPDASVEQVIPAQQALLYRLCGDRNPLHADLNFARALGFERPILHGLCTLGFAVRQVIETFSADAPEAVHAVTARMSKAIFPGETLVTEMFRLDERRIAFSSKARERGEVVLSHGLVTLFASADPGPTP